MFLKLLKHDMRSVFKLWWFVLPVIPVLVLIDAVAIRIFTQIIHNMSYVTAPVSGDKAAFLSLVSMLAYLLFLGVTVLLSLTVFYTLFLVLFRFFKNMFTDEGYLTFTLPVKRSTVLLSKTVNGFIWMTLHGILLGIGVVFIFLVALPTKQNEFLFGFSAFKAIAETVWTDIVATYGISILTPIVLLVYSLLTTLSSIGLFYLCLTIGALIVKKFKLAAGIGIYVVIQWIVPTIISFFVYAFSFVFAILLGTIALMSGAVAMELMLIIGLAMMCVLTAIEGHVYYFITRNCLERRLNLA